MTIRGKQSLKNSQTGLNRLSMQSLRQLPQLLGENDLMKSLQTHARGAG